VVTREYFSEKYKFDWKYSKLFTQKNRIHAIFTTFNAVKIELNCIYIFCCDLLYAIFVPLHTF
jgi:hypothetical protein